MFWRFDEGAIERFVAKEFRFCVRGSACGARCSGMVNRMSFRIIRSDMPLLNSSTCLRMYFKNASEDHRPMIIIMYTGVSSMNMAMAAADLFECVPMSAGSNPSLSFPMHAAFSRKFERRSSWVNSNSLPPDIYVQMGESMVVPG